MTAQFRPASQARIDIQEHFPNLANASWCIKSPKDDEYQCIAWAACYTDRKMWPDLPGYWWFPPNLPLPHGARIEHFIEGFELLGYRPCQSTAFEFGYQKVAIYANDAGVTHMARQHFWGRVWLSKPGKLEDILHTKLEDVEGYMSPTAYEYGRVDRVLKRSWWTVCKRSSNSRWLWAVFKFWLYRFVNPSLIWSNISRNVF